MVDICIFGDSIAWGAWDKDRGGWVSRLRSYLEMQGYDAFIYNCGIPGDTTEDLLTRFMAEAKAREPGIVVFAIGINDSYVLEDESHKVEVEAFSRNLKLLGEQARAFTNVVIYLGLTKVDERFTTPRPHKTIYYHNKSIQAYSERIRNHCESNLFHYLEVYDLLENDDLDDGLHPNSKGHEKLALQVLNYVISNNLVGK